jgi:cell division protein ZapE
LAESPASAPAAPATPDALRVLYAQQLARGDFQSDPEQLQALEKLVALRARLIAAGPPRRMLPRWLGALVRSDAPVVRGLYLWGGVGRGKTWLMDLFFASLPFADKRRSHFHRFMYDVHERLRHTHRQRSPLQRIAQSIAREARVLCFDELFVADIGDAMILGGLFTELFRCGVTLVATSNVPPAQLYQDGLQRARFLPAIALLERHMEVFRLAGATDYRLRQLTQAGTYLLSDAPAAANARLEALYARLAGTDAGRGGALKIAGRAIEVVRAAHGVVWFDFRALCAGPRSTDDYIEIAREYQSVIVSDVPRFDAQSEDEARRFIALVDELYDRNVNLVLSAAAPPAELYRGERLAALFARTASRLVEMQSEEYLAREHRP